MVDANVDAKGTREVAAGLSRNILYSRRKARRIIAKNHYRPAKPERGAGRRLERFPEIKLAHHRRSAVRRLEEGRSRTTSTMVAYSTRSTSRPSKPGCHVDWLRRAPAAVAIQKPSVIPGFGLALGFSLAYLTLIILIPLVRAGAGVRQPSAGRSSGRSPPTGAPSSR